VQGSWACTVVIADFDSRFHEALLTALNARATNDGGKVAWGLKLLSVMHYSRRIALSSRLGAKRVEKMKVTIVGLVTPHVLRVIDLANEAEKGINVDWHLRDAVARTVDDLGQQYNAQDLLSAYIQGLETAAQDAERVRKVYAGALQAAATAARNLKQRNE